MNEAKGLRAEMINEIFFKNAISGQFSENAKIEITSFSLHDIDTSAGNTVEMTGKAEAMNGHFAYDVNYTVNGKPTTTCIVVKAKIHSRQVLKNVRGFYAAGGAELAKTYDLANPNLLSNTHIREVMIYAEVNDERFKKYTPKIYNTVLDEPNEIYCFNMELFQNMIQNNKKVPEDWNAELIEIVMRNMAEVHSVHLNDTAKIENRPWCDSVKDMNINDTMNHWNCLLEYLAKDVTDLFTPERVRTLEEILKQYPRQWKAMTQAPLTLNHNNFTPRNMFLQGGEEQLKMKLYDWDMSWIHVPQRDICEFLSWVTTGKIEEVKHYAEIYRQNLEHSSGRKLPAGEFFEIFEFACSDLIFSKTMNAGVMHRHFKKLPTLARRLDGQVALVKALMTKGLK